MAEKKKTYCLWSPDLQTRGEGGELHVLVTQCGYWRLGVKAKPQAYTHTNTHTSLSIRHHGGVKGHLHLLALTKLSLAWLMQI